MDSIEAQRTAPDAGFVLPGVFVTITASTAVVTLDGDGYDLENIGSIAGAVALLNQRPEVHAIVLQGTRGSFWLGASSRLLAHMSAAPHAERMEIVRRGQANIRSILECPKLVVAYVDGFAAGGGVDLMLACDLVLVTPRTRVNLFYAKLGVVPDHGALFLLAEHVGWPRALQIAEVPPSWSAEDLLALAVADRAVPEALDASAWERVLRRELRVVPTLRAALKATRWRAIGQGLEAHFAEVAGCMADLLARPEQKALLMRVQAMQAVKTQAG